MKSNLRAARKVMSGAKHTARKLSPSKQKLASEMIPVLRREAKYQKNPKQAVAVALNMAREGRLRSGGIYVPAKKK